MMNALSSQHLIRLPPVPTSSNSPSPSVPRSRLPKPANGASTPSGAMAVTHKWVEVPLQAISTNAQLLLDAEYSDVALAFAGHLFQAHRAIICKRSPIFKAECDGRFAEAQARRIDIGAPSATLGAIARLLAYLYSHDYPDKASITRELNTRGKPAIFVKYHEVSDTGDTTSEDSTHKQELITLEPDANPTNEASDSQCNYVDPASIPLRHVHVYGLGDFYQITDLKDTARRKFGDALSECLEAKELSEVIAQVYEYTFSNDTLRDIVVEHTAALRHRLNSDPVFLSNVCTIADFMKDYLQATTQSYENEIAEQTENVMKERDRVAQQLTAEKAKSSSLKLQVTNHLATVSSQNKRITGLARLCSSFNSKTTCPTCQTHQHLQMAKPRLKRPQSPRTDEDAWFLQCTQCSRRISSAGDTTRSAATASPS